MAGFLAQLVFKDIPRATFTRVARLDETVRGTNGFGSTGR